jgi:hypothetical protein
MGSSVRPKRRVGIVNGRGFGPGQGATATGGGGQPRGWISCWRAALLEHRQLFIVHPVDAIDRTGVDRFLDPIRAVTVLAEGPGATPGRLHHEGVAGHVGAVAATDAYGFIHPDGLLAEISPQEWLTTRSGVDLKGIQRAGRRWKDSPLSDSLPRPQPSQRVTTSSMLPSGWRSAR